MKMKPETLGNIQDIEPFITEREPYSGPQLSQHRPEEAISYDCIFPGLTPH